MSKVDDKIDKITPMMAKIREYWITADGKPELKEFAEYMVAYTDKAMIDILGKVEVQESGNKSTDWSAFYSIQDLIAKIKRGK
jgi:hypothetical protein